MTTIIKRNRGEKARGIRAIDGFRNTLMIPDFEIPKCPEFEVKSKIGKIFKKHNLLKEYSVKIYEIDPYFYKNYEKAIQGDKNGCKYILFRIDIYFSVFQQYKLMKKDILIKTLFLRKKDKKHQKKNLVVNLLELIQAMQKMVMIQIMRLVMYKHLLMSSKIKKIKKLEKQLIKEKEMREKLEKELKDKN